MIASKPPQPQSQPDQDLIVMLDSIRHALRDCTENHSDICNQNRSHLLHHRNLELSTLVSDSRFIVLNIETLRLQTITPDDSFVALSYVWGRKDITSQTNNDDGNVSSVDAERLPKTLLDAIEICRRLEYQYIWIDQLCINQNDPMALRSQIRRMDQVYASATATIVVACNTSADEGIFCHIQSSYTSDSEHWVDELEHSVWSERAWTYQEVQLSRRLIIVTRRGIFFHCPNARKILSIWALPRIDHISSWSAYSVILKEYTSRRLSCKTDTLNAIAGMARSLGRFTDDSFLAGIPSKQIWCGILWQPTGPNIRQSQWPSWSWAGWTGHGNSMCAVFYPSSHQVQKKQDHDPQHPVSFYSTLREIQFYDADSAVQLEMSNETQISDSTDRALEHCSWDCKNPCPRLANPMPDKSFYDNGILSFTATVLKLDIEPTQNCSLKFPQLRQCRLLMKDLWVGSMFLAEDSLPNTKLTGAEFIVVTSFRAYLHEYESTVFGEMLASNPETHAFDDLFSERARREHSFKFDAWKKGRYHSQHGWKSRNHRHGSMNFDSDHGGLGDPHMGMPFPPELDMSHVLWVERNADQDLAYRRGMGIVVLQLDNDGRHERIRLA